MITNRFLCHKWIVYITFILVIVGTSGCREEKKIEMPFQTIAAEVGGLEYTKEEPALVIITRPDQIESSELEVIFPPDLLEKMSQLDYEQYFVVLVLQGLQPNSGYGVTVKQINFEDGQMIIEVDFRTPTPGTRVLNAVTSPYHLIAVPKKKVQGQSIRFSLVVNDEPLIEGTREIP